MRDRSQINREYLLRVCGSLAIGLSVLIYLASTRPAQAEETPPAFDVFMSRPVWKSLPQRFVGILASRLQTRANAREFVTLCEKTGILENKIVKLARIDNQGYSLGSVATYLTSYANAMGEQNNFKEAKEALDLALLLKPRHFTAWVSIAMVEVNLKNCGAAVTWADQVLTFKPDPKSNDPWEQGAARMMTPEGEQFSAKALNDPSLVGSWKQVQEDMKAIKDFCLHKR